MKKNLLLIVLLSCLLQVNANPFSTNSSINSNPLSEIKKISKEKGVDINSKKNDSIADQQNNTLLMGCGTSLTAPASACVNVVINLTFFCSGGNSALLSTNGAGVLNQINNTSGTYTPDPADAGNTITFTVDNGGENGCIGGTITASKLVLIKPLPDVGTTPVGSITACQGQNGVTYSLGAIANATGYIWTVPSGGSIISGSNTNSITVNYSSSATSGNVTVTGTNTCGNGTTGIAAITIPPTPTVNISGVLTICFGSHTVLTGSGATTYTWSANTGSVTTNTVNVNPTVNTTYTLTGANGTCTAVASAAITLVNVVTPDICMVTVDDSSKNNVIYWDKTVYTNMDSFIVYREVSTNIYKRIGATSKNSLSLFVDVTRSVGPANGDPNISSYRYKLQLRDTCGNYSVLSPYHNSVWFNDQHTGTFTWNTYLIEGMGSTPVTNFNLMRDDNNTNNYLLIGTASGTQTTLNDPNYAIYQSTGNWRVDATGFSCTPTMRLANNSTQSAIVKSKSNITNNRTTNSGALAIGSKQVSVYPNPAANELTIEATGHSGKMHYAVYTMSGQEVKTGDINSATNSFKETISVSDLSAGMYFIKLNDDKNSWTRKINVE